MVSFLQLIGVAITARYE